MPYNPALGYNYHKMHIPTYLGFWLNAFKQKGIVTDKAKSIFDIDFASFKQQADLLIFDVDDTLTAFKQEIPQDTLDLMADLKSKGWQIAVYSNCSEQRSRELTQIFSPLKITSQMQSEKPKAEGYLQLAKEVNIDPFRAIMIGDKIGTDLYGAYLAGIKHRILVEPYSKVHKKPGADIFNKLVRYIEKVFYFVILRNHVRKKEA